MRCWETRVKWRKPKRSCTKTSRCSRTNWRASSLQVRFCETSETDYYRTQTKFAKIIFLHVTLILSTERGVVSQHALQVSGGGGGIPACLAGLQAHTQGGSLRGLALWRSSGPHPWDFSRPTPGGISRHTVEGAPGPHPVESLRGLARGSPGPHLGEVEGSGLGCLRPTPSEVSRHTVGGFGPTHRRGLQAHTGGGSSDPHLGVSQHALRQTNPPHPTADDYCCGWYVSYWNAFLCIYVHWVLWSILIQPGNRLFYNFKLNDFT